MALRKPAAQQAQAGGFEDGDAGAPTTTAAPAAPVAPAAAPTTEQQAAAQAQATTAIAKAASTSLAAQGKFETVLADLEDALPNIDYGTLPRIVGAQGGMRDGDKVQLGSWLTMQLLSFNTLYVISPGDDTDESKDFVRYSRDGVTIEDTGEKVDAYLEKLRTVDGYTDASKKKYTELWGIVTGSEKQTPHTGNMVSVSLSPQSRKSFDGYRINQSVKIRLGQQMSERLDNIRITAEAKSANGKDFTLLKVGPQ